MIGDERRISMIRQAIDAAANPGDTERDEQLLAFIEATLRDVLGQDHGVWRWRCQQERGEEDRARKAADMLVSNRCKRRRLPSPTARHEVTQ